LFAASIIRYCAYSHVSTSYRGLYGHEEEKSNLLVRVFQHQILVFLKTKYFLLTTNGQLNDTRGYHIQPTNYTCNMISCFRLKGPFVRGNINFFSVDKF